jgi:Protein of unknown function (DUF2530)
VSESRQGGTGERRPAPPPKEADDRQVTAVITAGWAIAFAVVLIAGDSLPAGARWWVWTCAFGLAMGLFGLWYVPFLKRHRARLAARRGQLSEVSEPGPSVSGASAPGPAVSGNPTPPSGPDSGYVSRESGSNTVSSTETPGRSTKS